MRVIIGIVVFAALGWAAYWFVGARAAERGLEEGLAQMRRSGWAAEAQDVRVRGFPNRFDATIDAPRLAPPEGLTGWSAPFVQILALSYRPNHVIVALPERQSLASPAGPIALTNSTMRGSVVLRPGPSLALERSSAVATDVTAELRQGTLRIAELRVATRPAAEAGDAAHDAGLDVTDIRLPETLKLPAIGRLHAEAMLGFDKPLDRAALAGEPPRLTELEIDEVRLEWGEARLDARGRLQIGADGLPMGRLTVELRNWDVLLGRFRNAGLIAERDAERARQALSLVAAMSGGDRAELPLIFAEGRVSAGPVPLGPAPRLR